MTHSELKRQRIRRALFSLIYFSLNVHTYGAPWVHFWEYANIWRLTWNLTWIFPANDGEWVASHNCKYFRVDKK